MKVLASPIEAPRESTVPDVSESSRRRVARAESPIAAPAPTSELHANLDQSTRESLARLSLLIKNQFKLVVPVDASEGENEGSQSPRDDAEGKAASHEENNRSGDAAKHLSNAGDSDPAVTVLFLVRDEFPKLVELERRLQLEMQKRGAKIYGQQKNKDAVRMILAELDSRIPFETRFTRGRPI